MNPLDKNFENNWYRYYWYAKPQSVRVQLPLWIYEFETNIEEVKAIIKIYVN